MTIAPPTPFLPTSRYGYQDQSLLIDAEPTFDDSFEAWPTTSHVAAPQTGETGSVTGCASQKSDWENRGISRGVETPSRHSSAKRMGGESPLRSHLQKRARPPTPIRDDFYSRRVKDSDRRSSLGLRVKAQADEVLSRSTSRESIRSMSLIRADDTGLSTSRNERTHTPSALPSMSTESLQAAQIGSQQAGPSSISHPTSPQAALPPTMPLGSAPLHRSISIISTTSSSRRNSFTEKVTGFFSSLARRRSTSLAGALLSEGISACQPQETHDEEREARAGWVATGEEPHNGPRVSGTQAEVHMENGVKSTQPDHGNDGAFFAPPTGFAVPGPRLRLPAALTRPAPRHLSTTTRALQPKKMVHRLQFPPVASSSKAGPSVTKTKSSHAAHSQSHWSHPASRPAPPPSSSFAARAISRLPAPGKGSTSAARPTTIRSAERAIDLASKRETFERLAREAAEERAKSLASYTARASASIGGLKRTIPLRGSTPGKASRQRAEERARFERGLRERHEEKERRDDALRRARADMERAEDKVERDERVVWAKGLPELYARRKEEGAAVDR